MRLYNVSQHYPVTQLYINMLGWELVLATTSFPEHDRWIGKGRVSGDQVEVNKDMV